MPVTKTTATETPNIALSMKLPRKADFEKALLNQYTKAVQLSQKAGHQVSFRVIVDPRAGAQTISIVEEDLGLATVRFRPRRLANRMTN